MAGRCDPYKDPIPAIPDETLVDFTRRYIALYEAVTGKAFDAPPPGEPVKARIRRNLAAYF
jgi:phosphoribosylaminoimidazole-succinocarboxamide synthase